MERILERFDILPPRPIPGGTKYTYEKPEAEEPEYDVIEAMNKLGYKNVDELAKDLFQ